MRDALTLATFYLDEAVRLAREATVSAETAEAERMRRWLVGKWSEPFISVTDALQRGPFKDRAKVRRAFARLIEHRWLVPMQEAVEIVGKRRREAWRVMRGSTSWSSIRSTGSRRSLMDFAKLVEVFDRTRRHLRLRHLVVQHDDLDGRLTLEHPAQLRPVRARGDRRAHPRQVRRFPAEGHVDGRHAPARLRRQGPQARDQRARGGDGPPASSSASSRLARRRCWCGNCAARASATSTASSIDKGYLYKLLNNRVYLGEAVHKGTALSGRAHGDRRPGPTGTKCTRSWRRALGPGRRHPSADAGSPEGPDLRPDRRGHVADAHPEGRSALPLLRQPGRAEAQPGRLPGRPRAGGRHRGGGRRPVAASSGSRRSSPAPGALPAGRTDVTEAEVRDALHAARPAVGRAVPGRAVTHRAASG